MLYMPLYDMSFNKRLTYLYLIRVQRVQAIPCGWVRGI